MWAPRSLGQAGTWVGGVGDAAPVRHQGRRWAKGRPEARAPCCMAHVHVIPGTCTLISGRGRLVPWGKVGRGPALCQILSRRPPPATWRGGAGCHPTTRPKPTQLVPGRGTSMGEPWAAFGGRPKTLGRHGTSSRAFQALGGVKQSRERRTRQVGCAPPWLHKTSHRGWAVPRAGGGRPWRGVTVGLPHGHQWGGAEGTWDQASPSC